METITLIGNGNMALSIAKGLKRKYNIEVVGRDVEKLEAFENALGEKIKKHTLDNFDITDKTILLCVKPENIKDTSEKLKGTPRVILSTLAGTSLEKLEDHFKTKSVVRVMPNLAASVGLSMTTLTGCKEFKKESLALMSNIGDTLWVESEDEIDIATALAGSGPAYLSVIAEALVDGAVKQGLKKEQATILMKGLFAGFATLVQNTEPSEIRKKTMSPNGTTAAGYSTLEKNNVKATFMDAIEKAHKRAKEL